MPCTPMAESASRTSSSLNGLMIAVTSFMSSPLARCASERIADEADQPALGPFLPQEREVLRVGVGVLVVPARSPAVADVVGGAELPDGVVEVAVVEPVLGALVALVAEHAVQRELRGERV